MTLPLLATADAASAVSAAVSRSTLSWLDWAVIAGYFAIVAFWVGAILTVVLTGLYSVFGGLRAVLYTDACQAISRSPAAASTTTCRTSRASWRRPSRPCSCWASSGAA